MKKTLLLIIPILLPIAILRAQIPNASFENWTGGSPDSWFTGNTGQFDFVTESSTAHDGSKAAQCNVEKFAGQTFAAPLSLGNLGLGVHTATAPEAIHGWYIFNSDGNDIGYGTGGMMSQGATTGGGAYIFEASAVYKAFVINMYYTSGLPNGDSLLLFFIIANDQTQTPHEGSYLILDELTFGPLTGFDELSNAPASIEVISPNPSGSRSEIIYQLQSPGTTRLQIFDVTGTLIQTLINENQAPGRYKAIANVSNLASGVYFCRLLTDSYVQVRTMQVSR
jgi:hypothetical protein